MCRTGDLGLVGFEQRPGEGERLAGPFLRFVWNLAAASARETNCLRSAREETNVFTVSGGLCACVMCVCVYDVRVCDVCTPGLITQAGCIVPGSWHTRRRELCFAVEGTHSVVSLTQSKVQGHLTCLRLSASRARPVNLSNSGESRALQWHREMCETAEEKEQRAVNDVKDEESS